MLIGCKECPTQDCRGCNMFDLAKALHKGYLAGVMNEYHRLDIDLLREAVTRFANGEEEDNERDYH